jgi:hypothetical protein
MVIARGIKGSTPMLGAQVEEQRNPPNNSKPWQEEELRLILSLAPTATNCRALAQTLQRLPASIEAIYWWAASD